MSGSEPQYSARGRRWKLVHCPVLERTELFDLLADPGEQKDVAAENPEVVAALLADLERWADEAPERAAEQDLDPETRSRLEALGYVDEDTTPR